MDNNTNVMGVMVTGAFDSVFGKAIPKDCFIRIPLKFASQIMVLPAGRLLTVNEAPDEQTTEEPEIKGKMQPLTNCHYSR